MYKYTGSEDDIHEWPSLHERDTVAHYLMLLLQMDHRQIAGNSVSSLQTLWAVAT